MKMRPHCVLAHRQRLLGLILCTFIILFIVTTGYSTSRGATPDQLPLPIGIPLPEQVIHNDSFAAAMAMDDDVLAVGAPNTTVNGNEQQGVVYLYRRDANDPTAFTLFKTIVGSDSTPHDSFGYSVGIDGDTLVVGNATNGNNAAYVFERNHGGTENWGEVKKLIRDDSRTLTHFGRSLAIHGDTILVGAPLGLGEVFIFQRNQGGADQWGKTQMLDTGLPPTTPIKVASFGEIIAFNGTHLVISAPRLGITTADVPDDAPTPPANFVGAVFVYRQENGLWLLDAKLFSSDLDFAEDPFWDDSFGASLALAGDTLFVGASSGRLGHVAMGKVFVYQNGSGALPPYGQPGGWGEIVHLTPSDGVEGDAFGTTLYAVDDGLFVGATRLGVGEVYFFRNPAGGHISRAAPQMMQSWGEVYRFSPSTDGSSTEFGNPLGGSGDTVIVGDRSGNEGRAGLFAYSKAALFAHDPATTPTPSTTPPTVTPPPDAVEPCLSGGQTMQSQLFLPTIAGNATQAQIAAFATPSAPALLITDTLRPGCVINGPSGVRLAAVAGAITQTVAVTLETTVAPAQPLPNSAMPVGEFYHIAADRNVYVQMETPFVIALPVPANADREHLVITHFLPATRTLDSGATGDVWGYIPGVYDAESNLFLARMPFLHNTGTTLTLAQHPDFTTPLNVPPATAQTASAGQFDGFRAYCIRNTFNNANHCTEVMEATVEGILDDIYLRMTDSHIFNYPTRLRLLDAGSQFIVSETISVTEANLNYAVYLMGPKDTNCDSNYGYYTIESAFMALCIESGTTNINALHKDVLVHEFFHAVQYTYRRVLNDYNFWHREQRWVIESMANAAVGSYPVTTMQRSTFYGENALKKVDEALTSGAPNDGQVEEYLTQDFWVYVGLSEGESLAYLGPILALGGSHHTGIDNALKIIYGKSLGEFYWEWVKHQSIENTHDVGSGPGVVCELTEEALKTGIPVDFPAHEIVYPFATQSAFDHLPPLTAKVIEIDFGTKTTALIGVGYEECVGLQEPAAKATCNASAQQRLKVKVYVEGELNCNKDDLPGMQGNGGRHLSSISPDLRYFVVVANVDPTVEHGYYITIE